MRNPGFSLNGALILSLCCLFLLSACKKDSEKKIQPPAVTFETILYSDQITEESIKKNEYTNFNIYGYYLYLALQGNFNPLPNQSERTALVQVAFRPLFIRQYEFVPDKALEDGMERLPLQESIAEYDRNARAIEAFWKPWIVRLYGNEGAWYREKAKADASWVTNRIRHDYRLLRDAYRKEVDEMLRKAAEFKDPEGMYLYGIVRFREKDRGYMAKRPQEGWPFVLAAADAGYPPAQWEAGWAYMDGVVVKKDKKKAAEYFEKALDGGYFKAALGLSNLTLGEGGTVIDPQKTYYYQVLAANEAFTLSRVRAQIGDEPLAEEISRKALARVNDIRVAVSRRQDEFRQRWLALVPEVKKDLYARLPWLVWTLAPDTLKHAARQEYLAKRRAGAPAQAHDQDRP